MSSAGKVDRLSVTILRAWAVPRTAFEYDHPRLGMSLEGKQSEWHSRRAFTLHAKGQGLNKRAGEGD
jgi:hypothetical protein